MTDETGVKKGKKGFFAWLFGNVFQAGWRRWFILIAAVFIFLVLIAFLRDRVDYQSEPSAMVARDAVFYIEARDLPAIMRNMAMWPLWTEERRAEGDEQTNHVQAIAAAALGDKVHGLGSRLPLSWLSVKGVGALALIAGEPDDSPMWILFFQPPDPKTAIRELRQEPGITLNKYREIDELYEVVGNDQSKLSVGSIGPWLVVSSNLEPLLGAAEAARRPGGSLAAARLLPKWRGRTMLRGLFDPSYLAGSFKPDHPLTRLAGWMQPDARFTFTAQADSDGNLQTEIEHRSLGEKRSDNWLWSFCKFILSLVALFCLLLAAAILLVMLGWGGWLKALAVKVGVRPADKPGPVTPSAAFTEDSGAVDDKASSSSDSADSEEGESDGNGYGGDVDNEPSEPLEIFPEIPDTDDPIPNTGRLVAGDEEESDDGEDEEDEGNDDEENDEDEGGNDDEETLDSPPPVKKSIAARPSRAKSSPAKAKAKGAAGEKKAAAPKRKTPRKKPEQDD